MSDPFYNFIVFACRPAFTMTSDPVVLGRGNIPRRQGCLLVPNHLSPYDVPCLMASSPRNLDFVTTVEHYRNPLVRWFFHHMNCFPLDRSRVDTKTTRTIFHRIERRRAVVLFPEGRLRNPRESVLVGGQFRNSILRIAQLTGVPIIPTVILNTIQYTKLDSWLPMAGTRYGINFGLPLFVPADIDLRRSTKLLQEAWVSLCGELRSQHGFALR